MHWWLYRFNAYRSRNFGKSFQNVGPVKGVMRNMAKTGSPQRVVKVMDSLESEPYRSLQFKTVQFKIYQF